MNTNKKTYQIAVICSDSTTHTAKITTKTRAEANQFCNGVKSVLIAQGKSIFNETVKPTKIY
jgi:gamma-glutamyl phosphate reductase